MSIRAWFSAIVVLLCATLLADGCTGGGHAGVADAAPPDDAAVPHPDARVPVVTSGSVVTHHNSPTRNGLYVVPTLTRAAAATLVQDPGFHAVIEGPTYAHPLFHDGGAGGQDRVIVATEHNDVYALDASSGAQVWHVNLGKPVPLDVLPCGNIDPLGITGTPYLDEASGTIFLDAMILSAKGAPRHHIFALALADGSARPGWPVGGLDVDATVAHGEFAFHSEVQNQRGALLVLGDTLYVPYGGHFGDCGEYRGWLVGVPLLHPERTKAFATRAEGAGSWAPGGVASDGESLFVSTGNGFGAHAWSDQEAILRLAPGPVFTPDADNFFAPTNWPVLDAGDIDLGGSGPILVHVAGATPADLAVALGKDGIAYLIDRKHMGGVSAPLAKLEASPAQIITAASAYPTTRGVNVTFHGAGAGCPGGRRGDLVTLRITATRPPRLEVAWCAREDGEGSPMVTTTDGTSESIVWTIGSEGSQELRGFDGDTGAMIYAGAIDDKQAAFRRFVSPIVGKGRIYVAGDQGVYAFRPR